MDPQGYPDLRAKLDVTAWKEWTGSRARPAMFSSSPPTLGQTKDLITNCSP